MAVMQVGQRVHVEKGRELIRWIKDELEIDDRHLIQSATIEIGKMGMITLLPVIVPVCKEDE